MNVVVPEWNSQEQNKTVNNENNNRRLVERRERVHHFISQGRLTAWMQGSMETFKQPYEKIVMYFSKVKVHMEGLPFPA